MLSKIVSYGFWEKGSGSVEYDRPPNFRMVVLSFGFKK